MSHYFTGKPKTPQPDAPVKLPAPPGKPKPSAYYADPGLVSAVNVAIALSQPLLLTGEPGTGKTRLADRVAWELGYGDPLVFNTKSTSQATDLFYTFDSLRRFHAANTAGAPASNIDYLHYNALGLAILHANDEQDVRHLLPANFAHGGKRRSVVLIDEVDKAPRDLPNDLLNEIADMSFRIPELGNATVSAPQDMRPIVIMTSNSEKNLPDAFLRRCIYYHILPAEGQRLEDIIVNRLDFPTSEQSPLLADALRFFAGLREQHLHKRPPTAELIDWLELLRRHGADLAQPLAASRPLVEGSLSVLAKDGDDLAKTRLFTQQFFKEKAVTAPA